MPRWVNTNILLLYLHIFTSGLYFDRALWMLYLVERGMNMAQAGVLEALLHFVIFFFEVPTGMIADLYGRKKSLMIGSFISLFYALFMLVSDNFYLFTLAFAVMGLSITFRSGAEQALTYDTLEAGGEQARYTKVVGNQYALILISMSLAKWIGGFMAERSWEIVYWSIFGFQVLALLPLFWLKEPPRAAKATEDASTPPAKKSIKEAWRTQFLDALSVWNSEQSMRLPIVLYIFIPTAMVIVVFYGQEYFSRLGYSPSEIGLIFTIETLVGVAAAKLAHLVEKRFSFSKLFPVTYYLIVTFIIAFAVLQGILAVLSLFILGVLSVLLEPIFSNFVQTRISSNIRATFFSMISLATSLSIMLTFPVFGAVVDRIGFQSSFLGLVVLMITVGGFAHLKSRRAWSE